MTKFTATHVEKDSVLIESEAFDALMHANDLAKRQLEVLIAIRRMFQTEDGEMLDEITLKIDHFYKLTWSMM